MRVVRRQHSQSQRVLSKHVGNIWCFNLISHPNGSNSGCCTPSTSHWGRGKYIIHVTGQLIKIVSFSWQYEKQIPLPRLKEISQCTLTTSHSPSWQRLTYVTRMLIRWTKARKCPELKQKQITHHSVQWLHVCYKTCSGVLGQDGNSRLKSNVGSCI